MKKVHYILAFLTAGAVINLSSCSKDDDKANTNTPTTPTVSVNSALIDGEVATKVSDPVMTDKTVTLETTSGTFELEFAAKPTESGSYTVKSSLSAAKGASVLKEITFKYTSSNDMIYQATDGSGGTVNITIKDGRMKIDVSNLNVCHNTSCKRVSVNFDFAYTPPATVNPDPNPNPNPDVDATPIAANNRLITPDGTIELVYLDPYFYNNSYQPFAYSGNQLSMVHFFLSGPADSHEGTFHLGSLLPDQKGFGLNIKYNINGIKQEWVTPRTNAKGTLYVKQNANNTITYYFNNIELVDDAHKPTKTGVFSAQYTVSKGLVRTGPWTPTMHPLSSPN